MMSNLGFYLSGFGALYFFFIHSLVLKTTIISDAFDKYINHSESISRFWLKNKVDKSKDEHIESSESGVISKSDWSLRKRFAFWSVDKGSKLSFFFVAFGFILQAIARHQ